jgi:hypothetical protein
LREGSPFTDAGTQSIPQALKNDLGRMTTVVPELFNYDVNSSQTLGPIAIRDTGLPDLGYHYPAVDYVVCGATVNNCTLNIDQGTVLAFATPYYVQEGRTAAVKEWYPYYLPWYEWGIRVNSGGRLNVNGVPTNRVVFSRLEAVQESPVFPSRWGVWCPVITFKGLVAPSGPVSPLPEARLSFADFPTIGEFSCHLGDLYPDWFDYAYEGIDHYTFDLIQNLEFNSCTFGSGWFVYDSSGDVSRTFLLRNNIFERTIVDIENISDHGTQEEALEARNNLFYYNTNMYLLPVSGAAWTFKDNIFDHVSFDDLNGPYNGPVAANDHNAYIGMSTRLTPTAPTTTDPNLTSLAYQTGPLGQFYLPTSATLLIDKGSQLAKDAGLFHFTSFTSNVKEGNETPSPKQVNIGPHYLALVNGKAADSNGDGVPDFLADRNGDGIENSDEMPWSSANGGVLTILAPANNSTVSGIIQLKVSLGQNASSVRLIIPHIDGTEISASLSVQSPAASTAIVEVDTRSLDDRPHSFSVESYDPTPSPNYGGPTETESDAVILTTANNIRFPDWDGVAEQAINANLRVPASPSARIWFFDDTYPTSYDPSPASYADVDASTGNINYDETLSGLGIPSGTTEIYTAAELTSPAEARAAPNTAKSSDWPSDGGKWVVSYEDDGADYVPGGLTSTHPLPKIADGLDWTAQDDASFLHGDQLNAGWRSAGGTETLLIAPPNSGFTTVGGARVPPNLPGAGSVQTWPVRSAPLYAIVGSAPYKAAYKADKDQLLEFLRRPAARNFYARGHGPSSQQGIIRFFGLEPKDFNIKHRYRFVFLDGCQTANRKLLECFGIKGDEWASGTKLRDLNT